VPSRFLDELPAAHVEVTASKGAGSWGGAYQTSRFDRMDAFGSGYQTPGWQRAQRQTAPGSARPDPRRDQQRRGPMTIEGELVAKSSATSSFAVGERVFHIKFGYGRITESDGNKLTVDFEKAGEKKVLDSFVERV
jgi:DNA helicase II / ATP-dependent DNA helicase PcrA